MVLYVANPKTYTKELLELIDTFIKVFRYKIKISKSIVIALHCQ